MTWRMMKRELFVFDLRPVMEPKGGRAVTARWLMNGETRCGNRAENVTQYRPSRGPRVSTGKFPFETEGCRRLDGDRSEKSRKPSDPGHSA